MNYNHLSFEERIKIEDYLEQGLNKSQIARKLGRDRSTIGREIARNAPSDPMSIANVRYLGSSANNLANIRRMEIGTKKKINQNLKELIDYHLNLRWSPEQIVHGVTDVHVCVNTVYNWIYAGDLNFSIKDLREHGKHHRNRYKGKLLKRPERKFIKKHSIEKRPKSIDKRKEFGHWEIDTVLSSRATSQCLATFVERKSRFYYTVKIKGRSAKHFNTAMETFMNEFSGSVKSITCDRGTEFSSAQSIGYFEDKYDLKFYYAHSYAPHERGTNEYHNKLLREYFPKKTNFNRVSDDAISMAVDAINHRPRKTLNWKNANEVFYSEFSKSY